MYETQNTPARAHRHKAQVNIPEIHGLALPSTGYVRLSVLIGVCGIAKSTVWKWCADGRFPKPVKLSPRVSAWQVAQVRAWLADPAAWQAANRAEA